MTSNNNNNTTNNPYLPATLASAPMAAVRPSAAAPAWMDAVARAPSSPVPAASTARVSAILARDNDSSLATCGASAAAVFVAVALLLAVLRPPMVTTRPKERYETRLCPTSVGAWSALAALSAALVLYFNPSK